MGQESKRKRDKIGGNMPAGNYIPPYSGGGSGGGFDWMKLLMPGAGSLLGGLGGLLQGENESEKFLRWLRGTFTKELQNAPTQPNLQGYLGQVKGAIQPQVNQVARNASSRLGLDSGAAWQEIMRAQSAPLASAGADYLQNWQFNNPRLQILRMLGMAR